MNLLPVLRCLVSSPCSSVVVDTHPDPYPFGPAAPALLLHRRAPAKLRSSANSPPVRPLAGSKTLTSAMWKLTSRCCDAFGSELPSCLSSFLCSGLQSASVGPGRCRFPTVWNSPPPSQPLLPVSHSTPRWQLCAWYRRLGLVVLGLVLVGIGVVWIALQGPPGSGSVLWQIGSHGINANDWWGLIPISAGVAAWVWAWRSRHSGSANTGEVASGRGGHGER